MSIYIIMHKDLGSSLQFPFGVGSFTSGGVVLQMSFSLLFYFPFHLKFSLALSKIRKYNNKNKNITKQTKQKRSMHCHSLIFICPTGILAGYSIDVFVL